MDNGIEYWRCAKIFFDESWISIEEGRRILILGAIISPPGSSLELRLEKVRQEIGFIDEITSKNLSGDKALKVAKRFVDEFLNSESLFRSIIFPKKDPEFSKYCYGEEWRLIVKAMKVMLNNLYLGGSNKTHLIRPKIIIDFHQEYKKNEGSIRREILSSLRRNEEFTGKVFRRFPDAKICLIDSHIFESIQLTDILIGAIKWDIKKPENENKKIFMEYVKEKLGQEILWGVARWNTNNKFDSWPFGETEIWLKEKKQYDSLHL